MYYADRSRSPSLGLIRGGKTPKLELETSLTGSLHALALATPSRYALIPHLPLRNHAQCRGRRDRDDLRGTGTVFLAHAGVEICEPRERSD